PELAKATVAVPAGEAVIQAFQPSAHGLYVEDLIGGPSQIRFFNWSDRSSRPVPLKPVSSVQEVVWLDGDEVLFKNVSYIEPFVWMRFDPASGESQPTALA